MMKSLLVRVTQGNPLDKRPSGNLNRRSGTVVPGYESSSGEDSTVSETYGYTSGALNSNEDLRNLYTSSEGYPATVSASRNLELVTAHQNLVPNQEAVGAEPTTSRFRPLPKNSLQSLS